jgi:hypothetical protein
MKSHAILIAIKLVAVFVAMYVVLGLIYGVSSGNVFMLSVLLTVVAYLLGDLVILRRTTNIIATIADFGLAFVLLWLVGTYMINGGVNWFMASLVSAIVIGVLEAVFHRLVAGRLGYVEV